MAETKLKRPKEIATGNSAAYLPEEQASAELERIVERIGDVMSAYDSLMESIGTETYFSHWHKYRVLENHKRKQVDDLIDKLSTQSATKSDAAPPA